MKNDEIISRIGCLVLAGLLLALSTLLEGIETIILAFVSGFIGTFSVMGLWRSWRRNKNER